MLRTPTPFGHEMAGTVEAVGNGVEDFEFGDRVVVVNSASCGSCDYCRRERENLCRDLQYLNGAFAEYALIPKRFVQRSAYKIPDAVPFELAALTEPLACVMHGLSLCDLNAPRQVLLLGAGPIGLLFVAVLAAEGHSVEVSDPHPSRLQVAAELRKEGRDTPSRSDSVRSAGRRSPGSRDPSAIMFSVVPRFDLRGCSFSSVSCIFNIGKTNDLNSNQIVLKFKP